MNAFEWPDYRRDDTRLGSQEFPSPFAERNGGWSEAWHVRLGGSVQEIESVPDGSGDLLMADAGGIQRVSSDGTFRWRTKPFGAHWIAFVGDLDGDGHFEIVTSNGRELIILSAGTGEFLYRDVVGPPFSYGTYAPMFKVHSFFGNGMQILVPCFSSKEILMYDCSDGARRTHLLHRLWMDDGYHPSIVIGDVNSDGIDEIMIARLGGVYVFEPREGRMISQTIWKSDADDPTAAERRRNYGHFELADIDNDGNLEAIILSDKVTRHIAVLSNDGAGNFSTLWDRMIEHIYPNDTTELRYTSNSIRDFDGDGKLEIAVSLFNDRTDGRWHAELLRAETGERLLDLPDQYLRGVHNINGKPMFFLSTEHSRNPQDYSAISIYDPLERKIVWQMDHARFSDRAIHPTAHFSEFKPDVFAYHEIWRGEFGGMEGFLVQTKRSLYILALDLSLTSVWGASEDFHSPVRIALLQPDCIYLSQSNGDVLKITSSGQQLLLKSGYHLTTEAHIAARPGSIPSVAETEGIRYLAVPDFSGFIHLFRNDNGIPQKIATIPGRSRLGYDGIFHAAAIVKSKAGPRLVIVDDEDVSHARLSLYSLEGERIRSYEFPDFPASVLGNRIGCYDWLYFQHSRGEAMMASFYRSFSMNSECSVAFLLETGEILWRIDSIGEGDYGRGAGPWGTCAMQQPSDPLLQKVGGIILFCAKDTLCYLDLETGTLVRPQKVLTEYTADAMKAELDFVEQSLSVSSTIDDPFTAYGTPIVHDADVIIGGCLGAFGVLDKTGNAKWWRRAAFGDVLYKLPGIADLDVDGSLEFGQAHADGTFRIYDYDTGFLRARLDLHAIATDVLTLGNRFIVGTSDGRILMIGWDGNGYSILSAIELDSSVGAPMAADFDGDGVPELFVVTGDGNLRCFTDLAPTESR